VTASVLILLSSGLFLGWSLGANDASNVFGTAVASRMVRFRTAAILCSAFVVLGAVLSGAGAAHGLGALGAVNALAGSFVVALAAAATVYFMVKAGLPVSTTQAIVGAIVGWNLFSGSVTDLTILTKVLSTWVACPLLGAGIAALLFTLVRALVRWRRIHLLRLDAYTRVGLIVAGAVGSYALGANNIGNVMGVFVSASPFREMQVAGIGTITSTQQLFLLGALAVAVGVFTYSKRVMLTVGQSIMPLTPLAAWVVVVAHSLVLFIFSSTALERGLLTAGLPAIPLVPVSSTQAVVGAVVGIGLLHGAKGVRQIRWRVLGDIALGWIATPIAAGVLGFVALFVVQNVFEQRVYRAVQYELSRPALAHLREDDAGLPVAAIGPLEGKRVASAVQFRYELRRIVQLEPRQERRLLDAARIVDFRIDHAVLEALDRRYLEPEQIAAIGRLVGRSFEHRWQLADALAHESESWRFTAPGPKHKTDNERLWEQLEYVYGVLDR
jgi:PiT family inorganic phosphate transporter